MTVMTTEQRLAALEARVAQLEARVNALTMHPNPSMPYQPIPQPYPWYPPYKITCKDASGNITEIPMNGPIVAQ